MFFLRLLLVQSTQRIIRSKRQHKCNYEVINLDCKKKNVVNLKKENNKTIKAK